MCVNVNVNGFCWNFAPFLKFYWIFRSLASASEPETTFFPLLLARAAASKLPGETSINVCGAERPCASSRARFLTSHPG